MEIVVNEWQVICDGLRGRGRHLFDTGLWSDCEVAVGTGEARTSFRLHRTILAMASAVFAAEFYEGQEHTSLDDVEPDVFRQLLRYIYTDECRVDSVDGACGLARLAYRFKVQAPIRACTMFLSTNISVENVVQILETAKLIKASDLLDKAISFICRDTKRVLNHSSFLNAEVDTLSTIFRQMVLNVESELELVSAIHRYSQAHSTCASKDNSGHYDGALRNAICYIRFLTFNKEEFSKVMDGPPLMTDSESLLIFRNIVSPAENLPMPCGFSTMKIQRTKVHSNEADNLEPEEPIDFVDERILEKNAYERIIEELKTKMEKNKMEINEMIEKLNAWELKCQKQDSDISRLKRDMAVLSYENGRLKAENDSSLPTQSLEDSEGQMYEEEVEISVYCGDKKIFSITRQDRVLYNAFWDVRLENPLKIKKNQVATWADAAALGPRQGCQPGSAAVTLAGRGLSGPRGAGGLQRLLGGADELFASAVAADLRRYLRAAALRDVSAVLVFPPVSNYRRFLIHKTAEDFKDEGLATFSIGQGDDRRTVVCFQHQIIGGVGIKDDKMVVESQNTDPSRAAAKKGGESSNVYRPPQIRMQNTQRPHRDNPARVRRPDRAVYVPLAKRSGSVTAGSAVNEEAGPESPLQPVAPCITSDNDASPTVTQSPKVKRVLNKSYCNVYKPPQARSKSDTRSSDINLKSDQSDYCEIQYRTECSESSEKVPHNVIINDIVPNSELPLVDSNDKTCFVVDSIAPVLNDDVSEFLLDENNLNPQNTHDRDSGPFKNVIDCGTPITSDIEHFDNSTADTSEYLNSTTDLKDGTSSPECNINYVVNMEHEESSHPITDTISPSHNDNLFTHSDVITDNNLANSWNEKNDEDKDQAELIIAVEKINRSNKRLIKQSFNSDVLIISDDSKENVDSVSDLSNDDNNSPKDNNQIIDNQNTRTIAFNPDEESWEDMFDENGDWLEPQLVEELTATVGPVTVQKPQTDYKKQSNSLLGFSHVLEVYNFPTSFTHNDLLSVFAEFRHTGFEIKWVDDTHALAVFSSTDIAAEVLAYKHPMVKTRPLAEATHESRTKAKKSAEFLQPYRPRPETCAALAKRLVKGALGVKLPTDAQERQQERQQLSLAREKKKLAARHREEAWNGSLTSKIQ